MQASSKIEISGGRLVTCMDDIKLLTNLEIDIPQAETLMTAIDSFCDAIKLHDILSVQAIVEFKEDCRFCLLGDTINAIFYRQRTHPSGRYQLFAARQGSFFLFTFDESLLKLELCTSNDSQCNQCSTIFIQLNTTGVNCDGLIDDAITMNVMCAKRTADDMPVSQFIKFRVERDKNDVISAAVTSTNMV
jgi:hypothetical protein